MLEIYKINTEYFMLDMVRSLKFYDYFKKIHKIFMF
jgi:hypothetical protein